MERIVIILLLVILSFQSVNAQTDTDALLYKSIKDNNIRLFLEVMKRKPDLDTVYPYAYFEIMTSNFIKAIELNRIEMVKKMIEAGADVHQERYSDSMTTVMVAAKKDYPEVLNLLIQAGVDINKTTFLNRTALQIAALHNSLQAAKVLLAQPQMDVNNRNELCALAVAAKENHIEFVKLLIALKGKQAPSLRCLKGAKDSARLRGNSEALKLLMKI